MQLPEIITLDFETFYGKNYTLSSSKMSLIEYVRDSRFKIHSVGIKRGDAATKTYSGADIEPAIRSIPWSECALLCHNAHFDGFILHEHFNVHPKLYLDTLSMARAAHGHHMPLSLDALAKEHKLGEKIEGALVKTKDKLELTEEELQALMAYNARDVDLTYDLFNRLYGYIPDKELELIDLTIRMLCEPVLEVDINRANSEFEKEIANKARALILTGYHASDFLSTNKFADILRANGAVVPMKLGANGKIPSFAKSDEGMKALLRHHNPMIRELASARVVLKSTIGETRAARLIEAGRDGRKLPVGLNYCGAHTTRWSGGAGTALNFQNFPRGGELRKSIIAPKGYVISVADSAQIEARVTAWLAGHVELLEDFRLKKDVYKKFASNLFQKPEDAITPEERFIAKTCILGLGYGMGASKLQATLKMGINGPEVDLPLSECWRTVKFYRTFNRQIPELWDTMSLVLDHMAAGNKGRYLCLEYGKNHIRLPNGLFLHYYGLSKPEKDYVYATRHGVSKIYGGLLTENTVQALARVIIGEQMLKIAKKYRVVSMSHDEILAIAPELEAGTCLDFMLETMKTPPVWAPDLPLSAEGKYESYYSK